MAQTLSHVPLNVGWFVAAGLFDLNTNWTGKSMFVSTPACPPPARSSALPEGATVPGSVKMSPPPASASQFPVIFPDPALFLRMNIQIGALALAGSEARQPPVTFVPRPFVAFAFAAPASALMTATTALELSMHTPTTTKPLNRLVISSLRLGLREGRAVRTARPGHPTSAQ